MYIAFKSNMMKNTPLLILTGLLFMISACNKDEPKFVDKPSDELVKYVINLSGSKITDYSKYINAIELLSESENSKTVIFPADIPAAVKGLMGK